MSKNFSISRTVEQTKGRKEENYGGGGGVGMAKETTKKWCPTRKPRTRLTTNESKVVWQNVGETADKVRKKYDWKKIAEKNITKLAEKRH